MVPQPGDPKSLNRYAYALGNPLRLVDPSGHEPGWPNEFVGAVFQYSDDMSGGYFTRLALQANADPSMSDDPDFQKGRELGRAVAMAQATAEVAVGTTTAGLAGSAAAGALGCAALTLGGCTPVAAPVAAAAATAGLAGMGEATVGIAQLSYMKGNPLIHGHHPWPKYLGGPGKQPLLDLPKDLHEKYHAGLDKIFPRWEGTQDWSKLSPAERQEIIDTLREYSNDFDATNNTRTGGALEDALKAAGAIP